MSSVLQQIQMLQGTRVLVLELQAALLPGPESQGGLQLRISLRSSRTFGCTAYSI